MKSILIATIAVASMALASCSTTKKEDSCCKPGEAKPCCTDDAHAGHAKKK